MNVIIVGMLAVLLSVVQVCTAHTEGRWLLFRATHVDNKICTVELIRDEARPAQHGWIESTKGQNFPRGDHDLVQIFAEHEDFTVLHGVHSVASRVSFHDAPASTNKEWSGGVSKSNTSYVELRVPALTKKVHFTHKTFQRSFNTQSQLSADQQLAVERRGIKLRDIQNINTKKMHTLVFLSAGYVANDNEKFNRDVDRCLSILRTNTDQLKSDPWPRYISLLNIFSVFEPSKQSGASHPIGPDHICESGDCTAKEVDNNLDCAYGTPDPKRLGCSHEKTLELGSFYPRADIYVVIVNDDQYGGTGGMGIATINNGPDMGMLLIHEVNHAFAAIADEYSYGFESSESIDLPNCDNVGAAEDVKWRYWIEKSTASGKSFADVVPSKGCMFSNYYRPTESACLMHSRHSEMCAVCKERLIQSLYQNATSADASKFETKMQLSKPRCPPEGIEVYLREDETATLSINHRFVLFNDNVTVWWEMPNGDTHTMVSAVRINGAQLERGQNKVTVKIVDSTEWVASRTSFMTHETVFYLRKRDNTSQCNLTTYNTSNEIEYTYCSKCIDEDGCEESAVITPYTVKTDTTKTLDEASSTVWTVAVIIGCAGLAMLVLALVGHKLHQAFRPCELLLLSTSDQVVRVLSAVGSVLVLIIGCALIVLCVRYLPRVALFGDLVFHGILVISCIIYLAAVLKFCAVIAKWSTALITGAVIIALMGVCVFGISSFGIFVAVNSDSKQMVDRYDDMWTDAVKDNPEDVCAVQNVLECSGLHHSCVPIPSSSYCPKDCDSENLNKNACLDVWQEFVKDTLQPVSIVGLVCAFIMIFAAVADILFFVRLTRERASQRGRRSYRKDIHAPVRALTMDELRIARVEFMKADDNGDHLLQGKEVIRFLRVVFREEPDAEDREKIMKAGDLDFEGFVDLYFPHLDRKKVDPRQLTVREAEEAPDVVALQQQQFSKLERYMEASGTLSPEVLNTIYTRFARFEYSDDQDFVDIVSAAAQEHAAKSVEHEMLRGLTFHELEGLRNAWCSIHPTINGYLTDREIDRLYQTTHDEPLVSQEHFVKWKRLLDVRGTGKVGWAEFCYPFAQRALLRRAQEDLRVNGRAVEHEMLNHQRVREEFGIGPEDQVFLPYEEMVPVERVVALSLADN